MQQFAVSIMHPKNISILDYNYDLPEEKIAKYPLAERDASRLLIYQNGAIVEDIYRNIEVHIPENALLVFNNTKVVEARLLFQKPTGAHIEIFCLEPGEGYSDISTALSQKKQVTWKCLIGGASKWKHGQILEKKIQHDGQEIVLHATFISKQQDHFLIDISWSPQELCFAEILHIAGIIPLPPYIKRETELSDADRYQTVYALTEGSVAAPTAGLHFTRAMLKKLDEKQIIKLDVTLHVGAGTFMPVKSKTLAAHQMHSEYIEVERSAIRVIADHLDQSIIPVGTTSLRTIESLYWIGLKTIAHQDIKPEDLFIDQWYAYEVNCENITTRTSLYALMNWMEKNKLEKLITKTQLLIAPGYQFKIIKALITNFHQPQSTLLLLIAALIGEDWRKVYNHALNNNFRFLSYGDGCLLFRN